MACTGGSIVGENEHVITGLVMDNDIIVTCREGELWYPSTVENGNTKRQLNYALRETAKRFGINIQGMTVHFDAEH